MSQGLGARPFQTEMLKSLPQQKPTALGCGNRTGLKVWKGKCGLCGKHKAPPRSLAKSELESKNRGERVHCATRKGPAHQPSHSEPPLAASCRVPPSQLCSPAFPRPVLPHSRSYHSASWTKGSFQEYLQIRACGCQSRTKSRNIYHGMRTEARVVGPPRTTFPLSTQCQIPGGLNF